MVNRSKLLFYVLQIFNKTYTHLRIIIFSFFAKEEMYVGKL